MNNALMFSYNKGIKISSNFFLIILQDKSNALGNYELPTNLIRKIRKINYPKLEYDVILRICDHIERPIEERENSDFSKNNELIVKCMLEINKEELFPIPWSLNDIFALIKILQYQKQKEHIFSNFKLEHNLLFYALSKYSISDKNKYFNKLCNILREILSLNNQEFNDLQKTYNSQTELKKLEYDEFILKKNNLSITLLDYYYYCKFSNDLDSLFEDLMLNKKQFPNKEIIENQNLIEDIEIFNIEDYDDELIKEKNKNENLEDKIDKLNSECPFQRAKGEKLYSVIFYTFDEKVLFPIICKNTNIFSDIEKLFYEKYPYYQHSDNEFLLKDNIINKNQTIEENKINDKDLILVRNKI